MKIRNFVKPLIVAASLLVAATSQAATVRLCDGDGITFNNDLVRFDISTTSFPQDSALRNGVVEAMNQINNDSSGTHFEIRDGLETDGSHGFPNDEDEIFFEPMSLDTLGFAQWLNVCITGPFSSSFNSGIIEADIGFNSSQTWTTADYTGEVTRAPFVLQLVALHELGHATWLAQHFSQTNVPSIMTAGYPNSASQGGYFYNSLHPDDLLGLRTVYPGSVRWHQYTATRFNKISSTNTRINRARNLRTGRSDGTLIRGDRYSFEYTVQNRGSFTPTDLEVTVRASSNSFISTSDLELGRFYIQNLQPGVTRESAWTFEVPINLSSTYRYLGILIDENNRFNEQGTHGEADNFSWINVTVRVSIV